MVQHDTTKAGLKILIRLSLKLVTLTSLLYYQFVSVYLGPSEQDEKV